MHLVKEDILHQVNCLKNRLEDFDTISQGHLRMLKDDIDHMWLVIDTRIKKQNVGNDRRAERVSQIPD